MILCTLLLDPHRTLFHLSDRRRNIFCAKFVPLSGDKQLVTCALDGTVRLIDVNKPEATAQRLLGFSSQFVSKFEFVPGDAHSFLTAGQDGLVCLYDLRRPHSGYNITLVLVPVYF